MSNHFAPQLLIDAAPSFEALVAADQRLTLALASMTIVAAVGIVLTPATLVTTGVLLACLAAVYRITTHCRKQADHHPVLLQLDATPVALVTQQAVDHRPAAQTMSITHHLNLAFVIALWAKDAAGRQQIFWVQRARTQPDAWRRLNVRIRLVWPQNVSLAGPSGSATSVN